MISPEDYEELLARLAIDIPAAVPEMVKYSGSVAQPAAGSTLVWDTTQQTYIPGIGRALVAGDYVESGATSRPGALLCDGSNYLQSAFPNLFAAIGTAYGTTAAAGAGHNAGGGAGTFNVPDRRGRAAIGAGTGTASGATAWSLGNQPTSGPGGEQTHLLTGAESGTTAHGHGVTDPGHKHVITMRSDGSIIANNLQLASTGNTFAFASNGTLGNNTAGGGDGDSQVSPAGVTVNAATAANAASAHNTLGPVSVVNVFIVY